MARRSRWNRTFAAVFAPWFAVVMAEPAALHTCAMHSGHGVPTSAGVAVSGHAAHSLLMEHSTTEAGDDAPSVPHDAGKQCTCLGGCCAAAPVATPAATELSWAPAEIRQQRQELPECGVRATATDHALPFANGPPSRV